MLNQVLEGVAEVLSLAIFAGMIAVWAAIATPALI
jgi:hypothetical protein